MKFKNLEELVDIINNELGHFCSDFQYKRKELLNMRSTSNRNKLFIYSSDKNRDWVINSGGGTELQYHLYFRGNKVGYGLGFNTQYVPFSNDKTSIEYIEPFVNGFLYEEEIESKLLNNNFDYLYGNKNQLLELIDDNYVLIGKELTVNDLGDGFELSDNFFHQVIDDLKGVLFESYIKIISNMNLNTMMKMKVNNLLNVLLYKKQIILQGPPGTGKTYTAKDIAEQVITGDISYNKEEQAKKLNETDRFELVQFHPSYTYEDFVRGIVVKSENGNLEYITENKTFGKIAKKAQKDPDRDYVLIIDEINRANLPSVLGELIYALEYRDESVEGMYSIDDDFSLRIPNNLFIIGTMNTADRSVGHIDYAIRRRFAFIELLPKGLASLGDKFNVDKFKMVSSLFVKEIKTKGIDLEASEHLNPEFAERPQDVWIGHSYFITQEDENGKEIDFNLRLKYEVVPILEEYVKDGILRNTSKVKEIIKSLTE